MILLLYATVISEHPFLLLCLKLYLYHYLKIKISFTLHPAHSRVGRGNLVLRDSVSHFPLSGGTLRRAVPRHQSEEMKI